MKRTVSLFLALILLLGCLSGLSFAAEAQVETITLRPGRTVEVDTDTDFIEAYQAIYEPGSEINRIKLMGDIALYNKSLRANTDGKDPWMTGYQNSFVIRMPEGTCLDLNGCSVKIRANQGYDDNGTGKESGDVSFGNIIDTFGGGFLNLYVLNFGDKIGRAIELAEKYPELVRVISVSDVVPGAEEYDYTIPENVCLKFSGKASELNAKSITFKPGATMEMAYETAPGLEGAKAVIFQYTDSADKRRKGNEYATEKVEVKESSPIPVKEYKVIANELPSDAKGTSLVKPAVIEKPTDPTTEAAVIKNPDGVKIQIKDSYTRKEMQDIIVETAFAYYYQNPDMQYDGHTVNKAGLGRHGDDDTPEDAALDSRVYSVCSNFCFKNYYNSFDYKLFRMSYARTRTWAAMETEHSKYYEELKPCIIYQYSGAYGQANGLHGETDIQKAMKEARKLMQPGDIIVGTTETGGHAMQFIGDCFGTGVDYQLDCRGDSYIYDTGEEKLEGSGSIRLATEDEICFTEGKYWYLGDPAHSDWGFVVLRPFEDPAFPKQPTVSGAARLQFPRMQIDRDLSQIKYKPAHTGDEIPVYVTIQNHGTADYQEVPVVEHLPKGQTLVEGSVTDGAQIEGDTIRWAVKIPAGKSITLTYKIKLESKLGETVEFPGGSVAEIPTRTTTLTIGGKDFGTEQFDAILNYAKEIAGTDAFAGMDLNAVNKFYAKALKLNLGLPKTVKELFSNLTEVNGGYLKLKDTVAEKDASTRRMIMPLHFTGQYVNHKSNWERVREYRTYAYEPGDIFVRLVRGNTTKPTNADDVLVHVYLGGGHMLTFDGKGTHYDSFSTTVARALSDNILIAMRPTFAYEDIYQRVISDKLAFTDVSEADWFYTYVKDLVEDGTVAGMTPTTFAPKGELTFGQALKLITLAVGEAEQAPEENGHWASGYLKLALRKAWLSGTVDLNAKITRLQFCQIAAKAKKLKGQPDTNPFTDCSDPSVLALNKAGVIDGMDAKTFAPNKLLTRAQISKIIWCLQSVKV